MTVRVYKSTDGSAPTLDGNSGSLITVLDAILVNGYGAKSAAGWTKPYTGTNLAAFRNDSTTGTGCYLRVDDSNGATNGRVNLCGSSAMTAISTGTDPFPSSYSGNSFGKSATNDSTARAWTCIADAFRFHFFAASAENGSDWMHFFFGDIFSYVTSDAWRPLLLSRNGSFAAYTSENSCQGGAGSQCYSTLNGHWMPRNHIGTAGPLNVGQTTDFNRMNQSNSTYFFGTSTTLTYPNAVNNGLFLAPVWVTHATNIIRGYVPGMWAPMHNRPLANNDTFSGTGSISSKTFEAFNVYNSGQIFIETSDTWG